MFLRNVGMCTKLHGGMSQITAVRTFHSMLNKLVYNDEVPGSIPGGVTGFFSDIFPSDRTMALGSTQPLVKMSTRNIPEGKGGRWVRLTT
jgi:hypothetical protein